MQWNKAQFFPVFFCLRLGPRDQVVKQEEDQHQSHRNITEDLAVVPARSNHSGEPLHTSCQEPCSTQEVGVLSRKRKEGQLKLISVEPNCYQSGHHY